MLLVAVMSLRNRVDPRRITIGWHYGTGLLRRLWH
jgi:hypothetical protein